jgi:transposase
MKFGRSSEKLDQQIEQLELRLEDLETAEAAKQSSEASSVPSSAPAPKRRPARKPLPAHLPRETQTHEPAQTACPKCGGQLDKFGEDVSEILELVPASFKVIRIVRPKCRCASCNQFMQEPAPHRPIERGLAGPALLAHVIVSKYSDHLPLYRQSEIYGREGVELERSTLAQWVGGASQTLEPLVDALQRYVLHASKLHGDDIPIPVLAPGNGKTSTARLWTYVRDDRPAGSTDAPAVWFAYSPDRKSEHIEAALLLGLARRLCRDEGALPLPAVRSLHYFKPIVEEVATKPLPSGYIRYLRPKIRSAAGPHAAEGGKP